MATGGGYDYYELLGVAPTATSAEIGAAYRRLAKGVHPDVAGTAGLFGLVIQARDVLTDPQRRAAYDLTRTVEPAVGDVSSSQQWPADPDADHLVEEEPDYVVEDWPPPRPPPPSQQHWPPPPRHWPPPSQRYSPPPAWQHWPPPPQHWSPPPAAPWPPSPPVRHVGDRPSPRSPGRFLVWLALAMPLPRSVIAGCALAVAWFVSVGILELILNALGMVGRTLAVLVEFGLFWFPLCLLVLRWAVKARAALARHLQGGHDERRSR